MGDPTPGVNPTQDAEAAFFGADGKIPETLAEKVKSFAIQEVDKDRENKYNVKVYEISFEYNGHKLDIKTGVPIKGEAEEEDLDSDDVVTSDFKSLHMNRLQVEELLVDGVPDKNTPEEGMLHNVAGDLNVMDLNDFLRRKIKQLIEGGSL